MRIAVLGSGGIGGYYGALLAKGGQRGLTVRTPEGESMIPVTAVADTRTLGPVDLVLFCVKSYDTEPAAQALVRLMARDTAVVTLSTTSKQSPPPLAAARCSPARSTSRRAAQRGPTKTVA